MYVRPPSDNKSAVKLPENYSGNAFSRQPIYTQMPPPARAQPTHTETARYEKPINLDIPPEEKEETLIQTVYTHVEEDNQERTHTSKSPTSIFSSLLPHGTLSTHFPFGHGIGSEELLILAVMLLVFLSGNETGETDSEFILLLGLLLFAG